MVVIRKEAVDKLVADFQASPSFKEVFKNIVPIWTKVNNTPSVAVIYSEEYAHRDNITNNRVKYTGTILVYVYNKQPSNKYEDILTDLIEEVQELIMNNEYLKCNTIEMLVSELKRDGGTVHPYSIAQLKVNVTYLHRV